MGSYAIQDREKSLQLKSVKLINQNTDEFVDLIRFFVEIRITESVENKFTTGSIMFNSEYDIRELLQMDGTEKIKIIWTTGDDFEERNHTFRLLSIFSQEELKENLIETVTINFVDERYLTLLSNEPYNVFNDSSASQIISEMFGELNIDVDIETTTEKFNYYWLKPFIESLNEVRLANSDPLLVFQQNKKIIGRTYKKLFEQTPLELEYININEKNKENKIRNRIVKDISSLNIIDMEDLHDNGYGNKLLVRDYSNKSFTYINKSLEDSSLLSGTKLKFNVSGNIRERIDFPNYQFVEDYILTDFIEATMPFAISNLYAGVLVTIEIPSKYDENDTSLRSGNYLIHTITHKIDRSLSYTQELTLIKKQLFKRNF